MNQTDIPVLILAKYTNFPSLASETNFNTQQTPLFYRGEANNEEENIHSSCVG
jgi:hypothetical protein